MSAASRPLLRVLHLRGLPIFDQLRYEEVLLRHTPHNWLVLNTGVAQTSVVLGMSGNVSELVDLERAAADSVPMIRRYTGGGTVVVDASTVFVSFIMNEKDADCRPYPREIMDWSARAVYAPLFNKCASVGASSSSGNGSKNAFALREHDYVFGEMKFAGNAQSITKGRWVHHTSFLWDFNPHNMAYLKMPKKRPDYRGDRDHAKFLTTLKEVLPSVEAFFGGLSEAAGAHYAVELAEEPIGLIVSAALQRCGKARSCGEDPAGGRASPPLSQQNGFGEDRS